MTVNSFIKDFLEKVHNTFPMAYIEHKFKSLSDIHFIVIDPPYLLSSDQLALLDEEANEELGKLDPYQMLCFISKGSLVEIKNPDTIINPLRVNPYVSVLDTLTDSANNDLDHIKVNIKDIQLQEPSFGFLLSDSAENRQFAMAA